jgi:hypothetical protein
MADYEDRDDVRDVGMGEDENRPCAFCGAEIHPASQRCPECGGHVGLAWGTVHGEQFLFLLSACLIGVGCIVSWDQARPGVFTGLSTIRGSLMLALAVYGAVVGTLGILHRRLVVWPFFVNALLALWVGIGGITGSIDSGRWKEYEAQAGTWYRAWRAIPPGFWLLTLAGALVVIAVLKGIVGGFAGAKAKAKEAEETRSASQAARRRSRVPPGGVGESTALPPPAGVDPLTGGPLPPPPPPPV